MNAQRSTRTRRLRKCASTSAAGRPQASRSSARCFLNEATAAGSEKNVKTQKMLNVGTKRQVRKSECVRRAEAGQNKQNETTRIQKKTADADGRRNKTAKNAKSRVFAATRKTSDDYLRTTASSSTWLPNAARIMGRVARLLHKHTRCRRRFCRSDRIAPLASRRTDARARATTAAATAASERASES